MKDGSELRPTTTILWQRAVVSTKGPASPSTRLLLLTLSTHMGEAAAPCCPTLRGLCIEAALSKRTVLRHLEIAERGGWVGRRESRRKEGQNWRMTEYVALMPFMVEQEILSPADDDTDTTRENRGVIGQTPVASDKWERLARALIDVLPPPEGESSL